MLAKLAALDPTALDAAGLMGEISELTAFIGRAQAQLARLAGALDTAGGAAHGGHKSAAAFLRTRCGLTAGHAAEITVTGRALRDLAATEKALHAGDISFDQAQIVARTVASLDADRAGQAEQILLDDTAGLDTGQFRRLAAEVSYRADPDAAEERERKRWERRHLSFGLTLDDTGLLHGACGDTASFEILRTAAEAFAPPGGTADTRTAAQRRAAGGNGARHQNHRVPRSAATKGVGRVGAWAAGLSGFAYWSGCQPFGSPAPAVARRCNRTPDGRAARWWGTPPPRRRTRGGPRSCRRPPCPGR